MNDINETDAQHRVSAEETAPGPTPPPWPNITFAWAGLLIEELIRNGVEWFCIAPGSRSAPLALSAAANPRAHTIVHHDERGVAFFALGLGSAGRPAAAICSSGTAAANFFPAVIEASKKKVPLIILTADRPAELRQTGALQTIDQVRIYGGFVRFFTDMPAPAPEIPPSFVLTTADQAISLAKGPLPGPVHINCMFREPLAPDTVQPPEAAYYRPIRAWLAATTPYTAYCGAPVPHSADAAAEIAQVLQHAENGVIAVGKIRHAAEADAILKLAETLNWPIFPDFTSGLRQQPHSHIIHYFDHILAHPGWDRPNIDTVIHLGGRMTSKRYYQWLEQHPPERLIMALNHPLRNDPLHLVTHRVRSAPGALASALRPLLPPRTNDLPRLRLVQASETAAAAIDDFFAGSPALSEPGVARLLSEIIPPGHGLFISNSMPIRDMDMFAAVRRHPGEKPNPSGANRGASGIDGVLASAAGFAAGLQRPVTLLIGDLAFLHDLNSLSLLKRLEHPLIIVLIQNDGGGVFSFLPVARSAPAAPYVEAFMSAPHGLAAQPLAEAFGLQYENPRDTEEFSQAYLRAAAGTRPVLIEISSNRHKNHELHQQLRDEIVHELDILFKRLR